MIERYRLYAGLSQPFWWSTKVIASLSPRPNSAYELVRRVASFATVILCSPISLVLKTLAEFLVLFETKTFTYIKGKSQEHNENKENNAVKILNWNICGLPGGLPTWFGGVPPLSKRVDEIATFILEEECDVICLQEAHDVKALYSLCSKLSHQYHHFYLNIGSKSFQHNSGLFIASKRKISSASFTPFRSKGKQFGINKGYFRFDIANKSNTTIRMITTHMQPYTSKKDQDIRVKQLQDILAEKPDIVCGDLNIDRFIYEKGLDIIKKEFLDPLGKVETATDSLMDTKKQQDPFSIDYCLLKNGTSYKIDTKIKRAYQIESPHPSLSDHHALITSILF